MSEPLLLAVISFIFALMTAYSLYTGIRQVQAARRIGQRLRWYKQLSLLTGLEYGLLTLVFLLRTATAQGAIASGMQYLVGPLYLILLIPAAIIAGLVIHRVLLNIRTNRAASTPSTPTEEAQSERVHTKQEKEKQTRRQRQRRKKAAQARRRQAGKA